MSEQQNQSDSTASSSNPGTCSRIDVLALEDLVADVARGLVREGGTQGDWEDARGTGDVLIALSEVLPQHLYPDLRRNANQFLLNSVSVNGDMACWGEEVWDTAITMIALCRAPKPQREIVLASAKWLISQYRKGETNWYSEPWETLWALVAMHDAIQLIPELADDFDPKPALEWVIAFFDSETGLLVNKHYTAQFLIASSRWLDTPVMVDPNCQLAHQLQICRSIAASKFISAFQNGERLWTPDTWANSLIVWGLSDAGAICADQKWIDGIHRCFRESISSHSPTEDRAFAVIALARMARMALHASKNSLPRSILALQEQFPDPMFRILLEQVRNIEAPDEMEAQRQRLVQKIQGLADFREHPPFFSNTTSDGYYTFNIRATYANIGCIMALTVFLTLLSNSATTHLESRVALLFTAFPIGLGALASLLQVLDIKPRDWFKRGGK